MKYHNKKVVRDGEKYDSRKEYLRHCELKYLEKGGYISDLRRQVKYVLIPSQKENGKCIERECSYYADFTYYKDGELIAEDAKGMETKEFKIKKKLMLKRFGLIVKVVKVATADI